MLEDVGKDFEEMLDDVMGGSESHSPETEEAAENSLKADDAPEEKEVFEPYGEDENSFSDDSAQEQEQPEEKTDAPEKTDSAPVKEEVVPDAEKIALQEKVTNYETRLRDTQRAMHKANEERAKLQKELDALKKKNMDDESSGDDNWFADDTDVEKDKNAELESKIEALEKQQEDFRQEQAVARWKKEAAAVEEKFPDYEELVYKKLEPLLDQESGDPAVLAAYMKWHDKTPAGAYEFARRYFAVERAETPATETAKPVPDPTKGKAGLDRLNSADFADAPPRAGNMIDEVFG